MLKLQQFLRHILLGSRNLSKKVYTMGFVILSSCLAIAIVMLGVSGFAHAQRPSVRVVQEKEEEDVSEVTLEEQVGVTTQLDESSSQQNLDETIRTYEDENKDITDTPQMQLATDEEERQMRASANNVSDESVVLISQKDYEALTRIVEAEATGEDIIGKIMVTNVVLNRVNSSRFPNTIYDVIHQQVDGKFQFSPLKDGRYNTVTVSESTVKAVERALNGENYASGALFFFARTLASESGTTWFDTHLTKVTEHGVHEFYKY